MKRQEKPVGLTKDAGWQFGLSKTFPYSQKYLWDFMFSDKGLPIWLGELNEELNINKAYKTKEGIEGFVRIFTPYSHIRMNWKKKNWENTSIVQVRVIGNEKKATISFHQDHLSDNNQREEMKLYWNKKMIEIKNAIPLEG
jgi:hypothetical protein